VLVTVVRADLRSALSEWIENNDVPVVRSPAVSNLRVRRLENASTKT